MTYYQKSAPALSYLPFWLKGALLAYGVGWAFTLEFVGQLYLAELVSLLSLPFVNVPRTIKTYPALRKILFGYGLWLIGFIISASVNETPFDDMLKGCANIVLAATNLLFLTSALQRSPSAIVYFLVGLLVGAAVFGSAGYRLGGFEYDLSVDALEENSNAFKIRFIPFLIPAIIVATIFVYQIGELYSIFFFAVVAVIFALLDARSSALTLMLSMLLLAVMRLNVKITFKKVLTFLLPALGVFLAAYWAYVDYTVEQNPSSHGGVQLSRLENPYNPLKLLIEGRSEWTVAADAIGERPISGYGPWARDVGNKFSWLRAEKTSTLEEYSRVVARQTGYPLIPAHSVLLNAWIWGGLLSVIGCLIAVWQGFSNLMGAISRPHVYRAAAIVLFFLFAWDALFSPIGTIRLTFPQSLALLITLNARQLMQAGTRAMSPLAAGRSPVAYLRVRK